MAESPLRLPLVVLRLAAAVMVVCVLLSIGAILLDYALGRYSAITFISTRDGDYQIYLLDRERLISRRLVGRDIFQCCITWSPNGSQLAFSVLLSPVEVPNLALYIHDIRSGQTRLLADDAFSPYVAWSPDGQRIAYTTMRNDRPTSQTISRYGTDLRELTNDGLIRSADAWSPDGQQILYISDRDGDNEIYVVN
ncbi:partial Tol-Pal system protein TolB, partial [Planctomycetaceae bacterium]